MYWTTVEKTIVCPVWEVRWGKCIPLLWLYVSKWTRSIIYVGTCSAFSQLCTHFSFVLWVYVFCKPKLKNSNFFPALDREVECPQVDGLVLRRCVCCCLASQGAQWWRICRLMQEAQEMQVWISGAGRSPGRGNGNPLQYSCLKNSLDMGYCSRGHKELDPTEHTHTLGTPRMPTSSLYLLDASFFLKPGRVNTWAGNRRWRNLVRQLLLRSRARFPFLKKQAHGGACFLIIY